MPETTQSQDEIREAVRERYAAAAEGASCCGAEGSGAPALLRDDEREVFGASQYGDEDRGSLPEAAQLASLGCGNPTAVAELHEGETVLDLGSGGGIDVLLSAHRVGPNGRAYGLDMTDEMLALARQNAARAGARNVRFLKGQIEAVPLPDASVDVIISNCVINLSGDKPAVLGEAARVLRPGGRLAFTDVVADPEMDDATRQDMQQWTGCIAGALTVEDFRRELAAAGLEQIEINETHRVHEHAGSAIIRARKPDTSACCSTSERAGCCEPAAQPECCGTTTAEQTPSSCGCQVGGTARNAAGRPHATASSEDTGSRLSARQARVSRTPFPRDPGAPQRTVLRAAPGICL